MISKSSAIKLFRKMLPSVIFRKKSEISALCWYQNGKIWQGSPLIKLEISRKSIWQRHKTPHVSRAIHTAKTSVEVGILLPWPNLDPLFEFLPKKLRKTTQKCTKNSQFWRFLFKIGHFWPNFNTENPRNLSFGQKKNCRKYVSLE